MENFGVTEVLLSIVTLILGGAVPWAFLVERRLSRIEARLTNGLADRLSGVSNKLNEKSDELSKLRDRVKDLEGEISRGILPKAEQRVRELEDTARDLGGKIEMVLKYFDKNED